jgi:two-component system LytT family response regulator
MRIIIIDDEKPARDELRRMLHAYDDVEVVGECANAIEGIAAINRLSPDAVFLDICMPRLSGMEMLSMLDPARKPQVVFVTAYEDYAVRAFDERAFDYLLKPVAPDRLQKSLERLRFGCHQEPSSETIPPLMHVPCWGHNRIYLIKVCDIAYVVSRTEGVIVFNREGQSRLTELTLKTLEERTPLIRCHRQALVHPDAIREIVFQDNESAEIITLKDQRIPVSRRCLGPLMSRLALS